MSRKKQLAKNPPPPEPARRRFSIGPRLIILVLVVASMAGFGYWVFADWYFIVAENTVSTYVGRQTCIQCHQHEAHEWEGSHHDKAMDLATDETVLGNFDNAEITYAGIKSRFFKKGDKFFVNTEGPDGKMADFEIKYVFGVDPMQQYMVEFDRTKDMREDEIARVQVLRLSWDINKKQWFYIPPPNEQTDEKLAPDDVLHWTGWAQCWNTMCANCHSTNLKKNYDHNKLMYRTTFSEIDVSCEACHGPGSTHVELAENKTFFWDRKVGYGLAKLKSDDSDVEIHTCAQCHARQRMLHPEFHPGNEYYDHFANELLRGATYHADGQVMDEDYVFGSFIQSKMYHKGIRCSDCHNPHSLKLKHEGNKACTSCHQHPAGKYDTPAHHFHKDGSTGASCVECHMPETTYMVIDPRRDHSMRIPRPDLSVEIGTPNACTRCHIDKDKLPAEKRGKLTQYLDWLTKARDGDETIANEIKRVDKWAADNFEKWYGKKDDLEDHFAVAFATIREGKDRSPTKLIALARNKKLPAIIRATAMMELAADSSEESRDAALALLKDRNAQIRASALTRLQTDLGYLRGEFDNVDTMVRGHRSRIQQFERALQDPRFKGSSEGEPNQIVGMLRREKEALRQVEPIHREIKKAVAKQLEDVLPLLNDPTRLVRTETARVLSQVSPELLDELADTKKRKAFENALQEYREMQLVNNDRAGAHLMLAQLAENQRDEEDAEKWYRTAMKVQPGTTGPRLNLASLLERRATLLQRRAQGIATQGDRQSAEKLLAQAFGYHGEISKLRREELDLLERDARLAPNEPGLQFEFGRSLYTHQRFEEAERAFLRAAELAPLNPHYAYFIALFYQKQKRWEEAEDFIARAVKLQPENQAYTHLLNEVRNRVPAPEN
jgi:tetratricopeptide (TPR) repeat protein